MKTYRHEDPDGDVLLIRERGGSPGVALVMARGGAEVRPADLPVITGKLYEACGLPAPVILTPSSARFNEDGRFRFGGFGFKLYPEGVAPSLPGIEAKAVPPAALRELAAHIVALADDAEANPALDPGTVEALAEAIHKGAHPDGCTLGTEEKYRVAARTALRWMNAKAARNA